MQKQFKYIYNNEEVSREDFEKLAGDSLKWFDGDCIVSVPFSSFTGNFKSNRQINDHLKGILNGASTRHKSQNGETYKEIVGNLEDDINNRLKLSKKINKESMEKYKSLYTKADKKCSTQCFCDGSCKKPQEKKLGGYSKPNVYVNSTRHKAREEGKFHKEIVGDLEEFNKPKGVEVSLKELKENTINNVELGLDIADILGITLCDNRDYIYKLIEKKISAKKEQKDEVITNSNRGEKETMEYLQGVKESQSVDKAPIFTYCKVNKNALEALSLRALYGHNKYKEFDQDWQNFTRVDNGDFEYGNSLFRHALEIGGEETEEEHLTAAAWNAVARLEIYFRNKLNKS